MAAGDGPPSRAATAAVSSGRPLTSAVSCPGSTVTPEVGSVSGPGEATCTPGGRSGWSGWSPMIRAMRRAATRVVMSLSAISTAVCSGIVRKAV